MAKPKAVPLLSAEWINQRIGNVTDRALAIAFKMIDDLTYSGYLPMESPATGDFMKRLTDEQKQRLGLEPPLAEGQQQLL